MTVPHGRARSFPVLLEPWHMLRMRTMLWTADSEEVVTASSRTSCCGLCLPLSCLRSCHLSAFTFSSISRLPGLSFSAC